MSLLAVVNPSRRRRRRKSVSGKRRRHARKMTAKQLRYFGPRKGRVTRRRRSRTLTMSPNPRRRSRRSARRASRRFRRNPVGMPRLRAGYITGALMDAGTGALGAVATDLAMTQAAKALPPTLTSRNTADGAINFGYYGVKAAIAIALGMLGVQFLPARMRPFAAKGTAGALTVQGYELVRSMLPADLVLGYMTPARIGGARMAAYMRTQRALPAPSGNMGAYFRAGSESRIGEGSIS
jgi:hypothetical protein